MNYIISETWCSDNYKGKQRMFFAGLSSLNSGCLHQGYLVDPPRSQPQEVALSIHALEPTHYCQSGFLSFSLRLILYFLGT